MFSSRQIIEKIYDDISQGNLSGVLPVLDEHIAIHLAGSLPWGGEFHGRNGFMSMISRRFQLWETYQKSSLHYFLSDSEADNRIIVTGEINGKLTTATDSIVLSFVDLWRLKNGKVIDYMVFYFDTIRLLHYVQQGKPDQGFPLNGLPSQTDIN